MKFNSQDSGEKMMNITEYLKAMLTSTTTSTRDKINMSKTSPEQKDWPKAQDPTNVVLANRRDPPLDGEHYTKISGMWTLKYDIRSPKLYELLINKELKGYTDLYLNNFYNHIQMCLNEVTRLENTFFWLPFHQETIWVWRILHPISRPPLLFLEFLDIQPLVNENVQVFPGFAGNLRKQNPKKA